MNHRIGAHRTLVLDCHVTTSTSSLAPALAGKQSNNKSQANDSQAYSLIAVMLGRLRMTVDECIQEYLEFGSHVFANRRWGRITKYDHRKLKKSIQDVIATHCEDLHEDDDPCVGEDYLRQWDFSQYEGPFKNYTCKV